jgi:secreted trypsin-like serine protease
MNLSKLKTHHLILILTVLSSCGKNAISQSPSKSNDKAQTESDEELRIIGGTNSPVQPFFGSLRIGHDRSQTFCGGTFIRKDVIVTAAHCIAGMISSNLHVTIGESRHYANVLTKKRARINRVIVHPEFDSGSLKNDIALVVVDPQDLKHIKQVTPMSINRDPSLPESLLGSLTFSSSRRPHIIAYGFGNTTNFGFAPPLVLQQARLDTIPLSQCKIAPNLSDLNDSQLCAGFFERGAVDTCQGDSGGPLVATLKNGSSVLVGLTSFGLSCALPRNPGIYTRISYFAPWIDETLARLNQAPTSTPDLNPIKSEDVAQLAGELCFDRSNAFVFSQNYFDLNYAFLGIAPDYKRGRVSKINSPTGDIQSPTCSRSVDSVGKTALRIGYPKQSSEGLYEADLKLGDEHFKIESMPASVSYEVNCSSQYANNPVSIVVLAQDDQSILSFNGRIYLGEHIKESSATETIGPVLSHCSLPGSSLPGEKSADIELRHFKSPDGGLSISQIYASVKIIDGDRRENQFLMKLRLATAEDYGPKPVTIHIAKEVSNKGRGIIKITNSGDLPLVSWELQCSDPFALNLSYRKTAKGDYTALDRRRSSALIAEDYYLMGLWALETMPNWQTVKFPSGPGAVSPRPGANGRIDPKSSLEMMFTVTESSKAQNIVCYVNYESPAPLDNLSGYHTAQKVMEQLKSHRRTKTSALQQAKTLLNTPRGE